MYDGWNWNSNQMPNSYATLSMKEKLAYGVGDAAANLVFQTQITFLMFFYTNVVGIAAGTAGTILLASRIIDAFNDPLVGAIADRTKTRWGHYRPWVLWSAIPMAAALVLCFTAPPFDITGKIVWAIVTYNLLMVIYAANNIPYCALSGVMTGDTRARTSLASWRFVCAMGAAFVVNVFSVDLIELFGRGDAASGYQWTMALWGAIAVILFAVTFAFTKERISPSPRQRSSLGQDISDLFHNGPWIALFLIAVLVYIQLALRSGTMLYYFEYYQQSENVFAWIDNFGVFNGVGLACTIVGVMLSEPLSGRFGKPTTFKSCLLLSSAIMAALALVPPGSFALLLTLQVVLHLAFGPTIPILWAMMADVADYAEWKTGRRSTALAFASIIFGLKLGFGVGGWLNGRLLEYFGYSAVVGVSSAATHGIVLMVSVFPALALFIAACVMVGYRLDEPFLKHIEEALRVRRNEHDSPST
jgi:glycoside/pentoside/hexuronide:cation symporter, GPH family